MAAGISPRHADLLNIVCYISPMSVEELEKEITKLSSDERARLLHLLEELDAAEVDAALERDIRAGKFDEMAEQALADHAAGKTKPL
ncbi:MAG TPA: hypothetical protein VGM17_08670 [Rhizomicrobium sp.]